VLGLVEGVTEFLPVSSTGHLILADEFLGLRDEARLTSSQLDAVEAYEIVIQSGAILAVIWLYRRRLADMVRGVLGGSTDGRRLLTAIIVAFLPTAVVGLLLHDFIKAHLQSTWPVVAALAVGGVAMIAFERSAAARSARTHGKALEGISYKTAFVIGCVQCLALWPGTSRSMATIVGGLALGLAPVAAAEFSFLLGLPTLLAATALKALKEGRNLVTQIEPLPLTVGLVVAAVSAGIAVSALVQYLNRRGLQPFGWYRIALAAGVYVMLG
jgi:undecaprenyl-diphosphatase